MILYYYIGERLKLEGETERGFGRRSGKHDDDEDVYYYIRWRLMKAEVPMATP